MAKGGTGPRDPSATEPGPRLSAHPATSQPIRARVVRHDGASVLVVPEGGHDASHVPLSRRLDLEPAVGDWVLVDEGMRQVLAVEPRRSLLRRRAAGSDEEQAVAANVDVVLLVCGLDRPVKAGRIQRGATLAWDAGATPVVVLTKAEQPGIDVDVDRLLTELAATNPGLEVIVTSVREGIGLEALREACRDRTVTLLGESGAGKSSIVNALLGTDEAKTGEVRSGDAKGRHVTTARQLHALPGGGALIDTPGTREVGLWVDLDAVSATFADIEALSAGCRFVDCRHAGEPGCAVTAAVDTGVLPRHRLEAWHRLRREVEAAARRATPGEMKRLGKQFGRALKDVQKWKGR